MMNNISIKSTALRVLFFFIAVMPFAHQHAIAQEAFYVYRNDGDFNGFFFDQVVRMECTKVDLEGVTHDDYVMQEIETADSIYRISLASIDSIGFYQPEIILNPNLRNMAEEGLHEYINLISDGLVYLGDGTTEYRRQMILNKNLPADLLPKVGDILIDFDEDFISGFTGDNSFCGKVKEVSLFENQYFIISLDPLTDLSDVFVQFISTEMITTDEQGEAKHRLAGWNNEGVRKAYSGNASLSLIDIDGTIKRTFSPKENVDITMECGVEMAVKMQVSYNISWKRLFVKTDLMTHAAATPAASIQASSSFEGYIDLMKDLGKIKFPANLPLFQTRPFPKIDVKANGALALKVTFPQASFDWNPSIIFDTDAGKMMSFTMSQSEPDEEAETAPIDTGDLELSLNGSIQAGIEFSANIETNDWIEDIFMSGIDLSLMVGPKLEGSLSLSAKALADDGAFSIMQGSYIKLHPISADLEAKAQLKFLWRDPEKTTFYEASKQWGTVLWTLLPSYKDIEAEYIKEFREISYKSKVKGRTFMPSTPIIGLFDSGFNLIEKYSYPRAVLYCNDSLNVETNFSTKALKAGDHYVKSGYNLAGVDLFDNYGAIVRIPPYVQHQSVGVDSVEVSSAKQSIRELFDTNTINVYSIVKYYRGNDDDWITATVSDIQKSDEAGYLNMEIEANNNVLSRYADVGIGGKSYIADDTIRVKQAPMYDLLKYVRVAIIDSEGDKYSFHSVINSCSREGDVFTVSTTYSPYSTVEYTLNLFIDVTNKAKPFVRGTSGATFFTDFLQGERVPEGTVYGTHTYTFEGYAKYPCYKFTPGQYPGWESESWGDAINTMGGGLCVFDVNSSTELESQITGTGYTSEVTGRTIKYMYLEFGF